MTKMVNRMYDSYERKSYYDEEMGEEDQIASCCGSELRDEDNFRNDWGIAIAITTEAIDYHPEENEDFQIIQTKNGPLSISIKTRKE